MSVTVRERHPLTLLPPPREQRLNQWRFFAARHRGSEEALPFLSGTKICRTAHASGFATRYDGRVLREPGKLVLACVSCIGPRGRRESLPPVGYTGIEAQTITGTARTVGVSPQPEKREPIRGRLEDRKEDEEGHAV